MKANKYLRARFAVAAVLALLTGYSFAQANTADSKREVLWNKLESKVSLEDKNFDGVLGVAILDLTDGKTLLVNGDEVFPQASSIKIAVLAELFRQEHTIPQTFSLLFLLKELPFR